MPDVLIDKVYKNFNNISRYSATPCYYNTVDNKNIVGFTKALADSIPYVIHIAKGYDTYDSIALYYYNNPTYSWIICDFNKINDPFSDIYEGQKIKVPSFASLRFRE